MLPRSRWRRSRPNAVSKCGHIISRNLQFDLSCHKFVFSETAFPRSQACNTSSTVSVMMARVQKPSNHLFFTLPVRRRPTCASNTFHRLTHPVSTPLRQKSSTSATPYLYELASTATKEPRWKATPSRMAIRGTPNRIVKGADQMKINESPEELDRILKRVLGEGGDTMLSDEVKWLAVTHKSFDHGRRGFNDRLAYLGTPWPFR